MIYIMYMHCVVVVVAILLTTTTTTTQSITPYRLAAQMQFRFPQFVPTPLAQLIPNASVEGIALMQVTSMLIY